MADEADRAEPRIEAVREAGLERVLGRLAVEGRDDCEACGDPIPEDRREALPSATRCHPCQEALERRRQLFRSA
jgi:phage/conjugal plasmid C-4 type zinc finger TraR family protein